MPELNNTILKNSANLQAYWRLESNWTDSSANGYTLTPAAGGAAPTDVAGKFGNGKAFAASSTQYASIANASCPNLEITGSQTWSLWVKPASIGANQTFISKRPAGGSPFRDLYIETDGGATWYMGGLTTNAVINSTVNMVAGNWYHLVGVYDSVKQVLQLWLNGTCVTQLTSSGSCTASAGDFIVGKNATASPSPADATLDDIAIFNKALSADEIKELYEGRTVGEGWPQAGLVAGYHLSSETDFSGNNYHLTNNNAVTFTAGKLNLAANFGTSNTNKYLRITSDLGITGGNITMIGWVKMLTEIPSASGAFFSQGDAGTNTYYNILYEYNGGTRRLLFRRVKVGVAANDVTYNIALGTTSWYQLCIVYDGSNVTAYINGSQVSTPTASTGSGSSGGADSFSIGNHSSIGTGPEAYISALIDEVQVYNVAKDARWVRQQYAVGVGKYY